MARRTTQSDVAQMAGVSRPTVSKVLSGRVDDAFPIPEETRQRILTAAQQLGYQPHAAARSLRSGQTNIIGLLVPDLVNPHLIAIVRGAEAAAAAHGYLLTIAVSQEKLERERQLLRDLAQQRMDGLVLVLIFAEEALSELKGLNLQDSPIVTLTATAVPPLPERDAIVESWADGAEQMMAHLLGLGHRRIAFIHGVANLSMGQERLEIYHRALSRVGVAADEAYVVHCGPRIDQGVQAAHHLLALTPRPTAILGVNDLMAIGALQAAAETGLKVPGEVSIAGFDDIDLAGHLIPPLTTVHVHSEEVGRRAVEVLFERIHHPELPPQRLRIPACLVVRRSTSFAPLAS